MANQTHSMQTQSYNYLSCPNLCQSLKVREVSVLRILIKLAQLERLRSEDTSIASWLPILLSNIGSQVKRRWKSKLRILRFLKIWNKRYTQHTFWSCLIRCANMQWIMDPTSIVEDTERTRFCPQTDRRTDGQTNKVKPVYSLSTSLKRGYDDICRNQSE